ncbi:MAG: aminoacyl-tRNA hydrolase [Alphaproteobacteria bacterium]|nr:aminoacyl-tRNA hydrolase [Alphaproteobacteria bacterium]MCY4318679.1 aminoacyl-tRNA hydrolase [Alphaproteobacteria bacterium]
MQLFVGLGNPGPKYARHRHNIGFMALDAIASRHGFPPYRKRFLGLVSEGWLGEERVALLKPQTFMNESGRAVSAAMQFYKSSLAQVTVFHDELDLAGGKLRVKRGGGAAGHNGLRSIDRLLGPGYRRIRFGIGHPGDSTRVTGHVLHNFSPEDAEWLMLMLDAVARTADLLAAHDDANFMNRVAILTRPPSAPAQEA